MNINPHAASLVTQEVQRAAMTKADIQAAMEAQQRALEVEQMLSRLEVHRITPDKELPKMEFLFRLFHKPCFPRGELVALSGKAKSGKTFVSSILMALSYRSQVLSVDRIEARRLHVLWYDTEQSEESTQDILRNRIIPMTGIPEDQFPMDSFDIFNVRAEGYDQRLPMLEAAVRHYHPDLVILDGIRDLVADINDGIVAQACMDEGVEYYQDDLQAKLSLESNIVTDHILGEQIKKAVADGIILQSVSALNSKKIYMLRQSTPSQPTQTELNFNEPAES